MNKSPALQRRRACAHFQSDALYMMPCRFAAWSGTHLARAPRAEAIHRLSRRMEVLNAARKAKLQVFYAMHHRYDVTVVRDATADYSDEMMQAALDINIPNYASAIVTTKEVVDSISSLLSAQVFAAVQESGLTRSGHRLQA